MPTVPVVTGSEVAPRSVHAAGIRLFEPSDKTRHNSKLPSRRIQPSTASC